MERRITLEHKYLIRNVKEHLLNKVRTITLNECSQNYGHILNINRLISIKDSFISNVNCDNVFIVNVEAETLKPEIGKILTGEVCMVFSGGIFLVVKGKQKVLIPISTLSEYTLDITNVCLKKGKTIIKEGSIVKVEIQGSQYRKQSFNCFGCLVE